MQILITIFGNTINTSKCHGVTEMSETSKSHTYINHFKAPSVLKRLSLELMLVGGVHALGLQRSQFFDTETSKPFAALPNHNDKWSPCNPNTWQLQQSQRAVSFQAMQYMQYINIFKSPCSPVNIPICQKPLAAPLSASRAQSPTIEDIEDTNSQQWSCRADVCTFCTVPPPNAALLL